jgi:type II secretory ATPase GspE/PulE/Tfp pilus assembly ATPase PilB-like protein
MSGVLLVVHRRGHGNRDGVEAEHVLHGEAVVMRLLRQDAGVVGLEKVGMADREKALFMRVLEMPHGIALVTGPTGSGKTTTLYSALHQINDSIRKIITIEDPVEYQLKGINQIQVNEKAGLTFGRGLRAILRHDPDVVLIGEAAHGTEEFYRIRAKLTKALIVGQGFNIVAAEADWPDPIA